MKQIFIQIKTFHEPVECLVGQSQKDNDTVIDSGEKSDLWFHAADVSSCHVVVKVPVYAEKTQMKYLVKAGAVLCKQNTKKISGEKTVKFHYTCLENVSKTNIPGRVDISKYREIVI